MPFYFGRIETFAAEDISVVHPAVGSHSVTISGRDFAIFQPIRDVGDHMPSTLITLEIDVIDGFQHWFAIGAAGQTEREQTKSQTKQFVPHGNYYGRAIELDRQKNTGAELPPRPC